MKIDELLQPVSDDQPCGPDLEATMDPEYDEYYFGALGRLPDFYVQPGVERSDGSRSPDRFYNVADLKIADEARQIDALLKRSRDIRLLVLRAQWEALAGRLPMMAEAIEGTAILLETYPEAAHPQMGQGTALRREALADLDRQVTVMQPLQFAGLTGSNEVSLRKVMVANGRAQPLQDEVDLSIGMMMDALGSPTNRKKTDENHAALLRMSNALTRIERACKNGGAGAFTPAFDNVRPVLTEMLDLITTARPDLRGADIPEAPVEDIPAELPMPEAGSAAPASPGSAAPQITTGPAPEVTGQPHARAILMGCEAYYRRHEPSSAALLLVTQARLLIGRPLIEALQTLLPAQAEQALVDFGPQTGFALNFNQLRQLSEAAPQDSVEPESAPPEMPKISSPAEAASALRAVEDYFRRHERSSPVPVLLQRARSYLDKDFQSLVDELIPKQTES